MKGRAKDSIYSTTVLAIRHNGETVLAGDGQVTMGNTIIKHNARKVRKLYDGKVLTGFSGATADAFTLFEKLEQKLEQYKGNLVRAAVELAKEWRTDKILRRLEALLVAVDEKNSFLISGSGDVIEPDDEILAIGSGGPYALSAAKALVAHSNLSAREIAEASLNIAASVCIYTNKNIIIESLKTQEE
ncbi:MAG: HslU--HslV peptidase proteolytic subunit [Deltaproteobacteria bacterium]|nr:MAG: HslU--HslV peptidase proteolytic subunit [Deltaproteobacteria bacterium]RKX59717.1 MAG: HslU--HslV peptidase proteolytic subunit [Thermodesulfobacteriota bacterium]